MVQLEVIEHARFRALSQIILDKEKGVEAFEEYLKLAFPYLAATKRRAKDQVLKIMEQEIKRGPLAIHVQKSPKQGKSRLKQQATTAQEKRNPERAEALYKKLSKKK